MASTIYAIKTNDNEYRDSYKAFYDTLEEAKEHIMEYDDWYTSRGTCRICQLDRNFRVLKKWEFYNGKLQGVEDYSYKYGNAGDDRERWSWR